MKCIMLEDLTKRWLLMSSSIMAFTVKTAKFLQFYLLCNCIIPYYNWLRKQESKLQKKKCKYRFFYSQHAYSAIQYIYLLYRIVNKLKKKTFLRGRSHWLFALTSLSLDFSVPVLFRWMKYLGDANLSEAVRCHLKQLEKDYCVVSALYHTHERYLLSLGMICG